MPAANGGGSSLGQTGWGAPPSPSPVATPSTGTSVAANAPSTSPGIFSVDVTTPQGLGDSIAKNITSSENILTGFKDFLFGATPPATTANPNPQTTGGVPILADLARLVPSIPVIGQPISGLTRVFGGIGDTLKNASDIVGGAFEKISNRGFGDDTGLQEQYNSIPAGPARAAADAAIAVVPDLAAHIQYNAVKKYFLDQQKVSPVLAPELLAHPQTVADTFDQLFAFITSTPKAGQRFAAGTPKIASGMDRMSEIEAIAKGGTYKGAFLGAFSGDKGLTDVEKIAYEKWASHEWSRDQALDFLVASGEPTHDAALNIASSVALDPQVWASLGGAAFARVGVSGVKLAATAAETTGAGRIARTAAATKFLKWYGNDIYGPLAKYNEAGAVIGRSSLGTAAKVARTIMDPLHVIGSDKAIGEAQVEMSAVTTAKLVHEAYGPKNSYDLLQRLYNISPKLKDIFDRNIGTYSGNAARDVGLNAHVDGVVAMGNAESLRGISGEQVKELATAVTKEAPKDYKTLAKEYLIRVRKTAFNEIDDESLANRAEAMYGTITGEEWRGLVKGLNAEQKGLLHAATYGQATEGFLSAAGESARAVGAVMAKKLKLHRLVLLNKNTLTHLGAAGILERIGDKVATAEDIAKEIHAMQEQYPFLRRIIVPEARDPHFTDKVDKFRSYLQAQMETRSLPMQLTTAEIELLPDALAAEYKKLGGEWDYGFRPEDDKLLGLTTDAEGRLIPGQAWADHVSPGSPGYRAGLAMSHNIAGQPLPGIVQKLTKPIDYIDMAQKTLRSHVSAAMITDSARKRFASLGAERHGISEQTATQLFQALMDKAAVGGILGKGVAVRGLSTDSMWAATEHLLPLELRVGPNAMSHTDMLVLALDAYQGDLRFVGLTQKFTGAMKSAIGRTGVNFGGQLAENLYPAIRFSLFNPIFQAQERIEGIVLNAQRGVNFALGNKLTESDRIAAQVIDNMARTGFARIGDVDIQELAHTQLAGRDLADELSRIDKRGLLDSLLDVKGNKRVNLLRTFESNAGKSFRRILNERSPGTWDKLVTHYSDDAGHILGDEEVAMRYLAEQAWSGDVHVNKVIKPGMAFGDFRNARSAENWMPNSVGEITPLDLDGLARGLQMPLKDGSHAISAQDLRTALNDERTGLTMDDLTDTMRAHNFHTDYITRVENSLNFDWNEQWQITRRSYNLKPEEETFLQGLMQESARLRGVTPVDYMTQVFRPAEGMEGNSKAIGSAVTLMRGGPNAKPDDLLTKMVDTFIAHMDPSGEATLRESFAGASAGHFADTGGWTPEATQEFKQSILDRLNGIEQKADPTNPDVYETIHPKTRDFIMVHAKGHEQSPVMIQNTLGKAFRDAPEPVQREIIGNLNEFHRTFPDVPIAHIDFKDLLKEPFHGNPETAAVTDPESGALFLSKRHFGTADTTAADLQASDNVLQEALYGRGQFVDPTLTGAQVHEEWHAVQWHVDGTGASAAPNTEDFMANYLDELRSGRKAAPSLYGDPVVHGPDEAMSELFSLTFSPNASKALKKEFKSWTEEFKRVLEEDGLYKPKNVAVGAVNPDVERATRYFSAWSQAALRDGMKADRTPAMADLINRVAQIPTEGGVPYNLTHQLMQGQLAHALRQGEQDAFRLAYFSRNRTFLERSLNHPFFGIYPASYMWGKVLPEMVKFMAQSPFGVRTGAAAYAANDIVKAMAIQREYNPDWAKMEQKLDKSSILWFAGYMLPSIPWDIGSSTPNWLRQYAQQGLDNQDRVDRGQKPKPLDFGAPVNYLTDYLSPLRSAVQTDRVLKEVGDTLFGSPTEQARRAQQQAPTSPDVTNPIPAAGLSPILQSDLDQLNSLFGTP